MLSHWPTRLDVEPRTVGRRVAHPPETERVPSPRDLVTYAELLTQPGLDFTVFISITVTPWIDKDWTSTTLTPWLIGRTDRPDIVVASQPRAPSQLEDDPHGA